MASKAERQPAYVALLDGGALDARAEEAAAHLEHCDLCPWACGINRQIGRLGWCRTSRRARVASYFPHMGEEDPLRGTRGSGTVFFSNCNMRCAFCQNYSISQQAEGTTRDPEEIADMMLALQAAGCHNINLVSPSHVVAQIIAAVAIAAHKGLRLPLVYNTGGYDSLEALRLLDGIVDIYMPDMKYSDTATARTYSVIRDYPAHNVAAVREMHRQVGDLVLDAQGIAQRGLLARHLVLPGGLAGTEQVMQALAEISRETYVNIMGQYRPDYKATAEDLGPLSRGVSREEVDQAYAIARKAGLHRFDEQQAAEGLS